MTFLKQKLGSEEGYRKAIIWSAAASHRTLTTWVRSSRQSTTNGSAQIGGTRPSHPNLQPLSEALEDSFSLPDLHAEAGRAERGRSGSGIQRGWVGSGFISKSPSRQKCKLLPSPGALGTPVPAEPGAGPPGASRCCSSPSNGLGAAGRRGGGMPQSSAPPLSAFRKHLGRRRVHQQCSRLCCFLRGLQREDPRSRSPACVICSYSLVFCATKGKRRS